MNEDPLSTASQNRDGGAIEQWVDAYGDRLLRSAFLLCRDETEAQDMVQETFMEAIRSARRFQGRSSPYTWLHSILLNLTRHYHRKHKRLVYDNERADAEVYWPAQNESAADAATAGAALRAALARLSEGHREVVILRYYEAMKIDQIARHLGVSAGTVKSRLHYAVKELQKMLPGELNLFSCGGTEEIQMQ